VKFTDLLHEAIRARGPDHPVWRYNDKIAGRELAALAGLRCAELIDGPAPLDQLTPPLYRPFVLKPVHGSTGLGVFMLDPDGHGGFRHIVTGEVRRWHQWRDAAYAAKKQPATTPTDKVRPPWILEALLGTPKVRPWEAKFFVFGGRTELIWQRRLMRGARSTDVSNLAGMYFDRDWNPVGDVGEGRRLDPAATPAKGADKLLAAAERVATHVESPFIRVDLYSVQGRPIFGEITPHPTAGRRSFNDEWECRLGAAWEAAL